MDINITNASITLELVLTHSEINDLNNDIGHLAKMGEEDSHSVATATLANGFRVLQEKIGEEREETTQTEVDKE